MTAKDDHYSHVEHRDAETDYRTVVSLMNRIGEQTGEEIAAYEVFSHPGATRTAGVWIVGPVDEVKSYVDLHPMVAKDYRDATPWIRDEATN